MSAAIDAFPADFTLLDLERACPGVSRDMVRRVLMDLREVRQGDMPRPGSRSCLAGEG